jgi:hypothetical protein
MSLELTLNKSEKKKGLPLRWLLDQALSGKVLPDGRILAKKGSLVAQLVKQPAGISAGSGTLTFTEDIDSVDSFGKAAAGTATINGGDAK